MKPLLCEFHAHTTWSDGDLSLQELVQLYGRAGFDVLCVTDHTHPAGDPWAHLGVRPDRLPMYLEQWRRKQSWPGPGTACWSCPVWS